jgi:hypothetical protein
VKSATSTIVFEMPAPAPATTTTVPRSSTARGTSSRGVSSLPAAGAGSATVPTG